MTADEAHWIVEWATDTGSLVFIWTGSCGVQPILMPGYTYYWWLDDSAAATLYHKAKGERHRAGNGEWRH